MPRKISEITKGVFVTIRLSKNQRDMFYAIGGHEWLRKYLTRQLLQEEIQLGLSPGNFSLNPPNDNQKRK
jgi:hypothetical protein